MISYIDDSVFALILRFVGFSQDMSFDNKAFLKNQIEKIKTHIEQFPLCEREYHTLKWIEQYAAEYRQIWNKKVVAKEVSGHRCLDCPLCGDKSHVHCQIHEQWLELIEKYVTEKIDSQNYVKSTLKLLANHKEHIKVKLSKLSLHKI